MHVLLPLISLILFDLGFLQVNIVSSTVSTKSKIVWNNNLKEQFKRTNVYIEEICGENISAFIVLANILSN